MTEMSSSEEGTRASSLPSDISFPEALAFMLRKRRLIGVFLVSVPLVIALWGIVSPSMWTSRASFIPQASGDGGGSRLSALAGQFGFDIGSAEPTQSPDFYAELITSRRVLNAIVTREYAVSDTGGLFSRGSMSGSVAELMNLAEERQEAVRAAAAREWLRQEAIRVSVNDESGIVDFSVTSPWGKLSSDIASDILDFVNEFNLETRQSKAAAERRFIEDRLDEAEKELRSVEDTLQLFLQNNRAFQNSPELVFEYDRLNRFVVMRQQLYTSLRQSYEQARIAEVRNTPVITVVEQPDVPAKPNSGGWVAKLFVGIVVGGMTGIMLAGLSEVRQQMKERGEDYQDLRSAWAGTKEDLRRLNPILVVKRIFKSTN